jgi:uncharacterized protein YcgI (DUF1989 family)
VTETAARVVVLAGTASAWRVGTGASVVVETPTGAQVGDLFAFAADDPTEFLSAGHTRLWNRRVFPRAGEPFVSNRRRPLLTLVEDTSPGAHDMLVPACDPERYRQLGVEGWHASCVENVRGALAGLGVPFAEPPQPVNVFMDVALDGDGGLELRPSPARPGDRLGLRAEDALVVALSACPQDLAPVNGAQGPAELVVELREASPS